MANPAPGMAPDLEGDITEIDLREYISLLWQRKWLIIGLVLIAAVAGFLVSQQMTRIYQSSTLVMVKEDSGMGNIFSEQFPLFSDRGNKVALYTEMLKSRRVLTRVIADLDLWEPGSDKLIDPNDIRENINITIAGDNNLIKITVNYPDPEKARDLTNKLVTVFAEDNLHLNRSDLANAAEFITEQLNSVEDNLSALENKLLAYQNEHGVVIPEEHGKQLLERLTELETERARAGLELEQARLSLRQLEKKLAREEREIISARTISQNPEITEYKKQLTELEIELAGLQEIYTDQHPRVLEIKEKITVTKKLLSRTVEEIISSRTESINPLYHRLQEQMINLQTVILTTEVSLNTYEQQVAKGEQELKVLPEKELNLARLQRELRVEENIYILLMEQREELKIQKAMQSSDVFVVDPAILAEDPIKPRVRLNVIIAVFLAFFLAVMLIFLLEYLDNTVREEKDIERLTGLPVLGVIPDLHSIGYSGGHGKAEFDV